jgi:hypothetical protein
MDTVLNGQQIIYYTAALQIKIGTFVQLRYYNTESKIQIQKLNI